MRIGDRWFRSVWVDGDGGAVCYLDQTALPGRVVVATLTTREQTEEAIRLMRVRGAPLIGVVAAFGVALAMRADAGDRALEDALSALAATRPTAVNLRWALDRVATSLRPLAPEQRAPAAFGLARTLADEDVAVCQQIGAHGCTLLRTMAGRNPGRPLRVLTHCNAGWLATVDWGTALAPIYQAHDAGVPLHVWVDETRPRNQGLLTAWELAQHGVPHTVIVDNAGGWLIQTGQVDAVLVGTDRVARNGDVANKIGTYLKALAAADSGIPFYVAAPASSIDWTADSGSKIPIEERDGAELGFAAEVPVANPAFDVTPARLVTGLITERGVVAATREALLDRFPEQR